MLGNSKEAPLDVTHAQTQDLPATERLYQTVIDRMRNTPLDILWDLDFHPSRASLAEAAAAGNLFIAPGEKPGEALGAFILDANQDDDYAQVRWIAGGAREGDALVLHVLAVAPNARGRGVGRALVAAAAEEARIRGAASVRLDVFDNNEPAANLYLACGFVDHGIYTLEHGGEFTHNSRMMELVL